MKGGCLTILVLSILVTLGQNCEDSVFYPCGNVVQNGLCGVATVKLHCCRTCTGATATQPPATRPPVAVPTTPAPTVPSGGCTDFLSAGACQAIQANGGCETTPGCCRTCGAAPPPAPCTQDKPGTDCALLQNLCAVDANVRDNLCCGTCNSPPPASTSAPDPSAGQCLDRIPNNGCQNMGEFCPMSHLHYVCCLTCRRVRPTTPRPPVCVDTAPFDYCAKVYRYCSSFPSIRERCCATCRGPPVTPLPVCTDSMPSCAYLRIHCSRDEKIRLLCCVTCRPQTVPPTLPPTTRPTVCIADQFSQSVCNGYLGFCNEPVPQQYCCVTCQNGTPRPTLPPPTRPPPTQPPPTQPPPTQPPPTRPPPVDQECPNGNLIYHSSCALAYGNNSNVCSTDEGQYYCCDYCRNINCREDTSSDCYRLATVQFCQIPDGRKQCCLRCRIVLGNQPQPPTQPPPTQPPRTQPPQTQPPPTQPPPTQPPPTQPPPTQPPPTQPPPTQPQCIDSNIQYCTTSATFTLCQQENVRQFCCISCQTATDPPVLPPTTQPPPTQPPPTQPPPTQPPPTLPPPTTDGCFDVDTRACELGGSLSCGSPEARQACCAHCSKNCNPPPLCVDVYLPAQCNQFKALDSCGEPGAATYCCATCYCDPKFVRPTTPTPNTQAPNTQPPASGTFPPNNECFDILENNICETQKTDLCYRHQSIALEYCCASCRTFLNNQVPNFTPVPSSCNVDLFAEECTEFKAFCDSTDEETKNIARAICCKTCNEI